jgi:hypothetical protein
VRNASENSFTSTWGSIGNAQFLNAEVETSGVPIVNGGEQFTLLDGNSVVDGPAFGGALKKKCYQRTGSNAGNAGSWAEVTEAEATPGTASAVAGLHGPVITEWCDADTNYELEYVEITNLR